MNLRFWNRQKPSTDTIKSRIENARNNFSIDSVSRKNILSNRIIPENIPMSVVEMDRLKLAINIAKNIESPDRVMLYSLYEQTIQEAHLLSQIRTAINTVIQGQFIITDVNGNENDEAIKLFQKSWFTDFVTYAIESEFWGHSLIEIENFMDDEFERFLTVNLLNRYNVIPEFGKIKIKASDDISDAIDYRNNMEKYNLIEIGNNYDLGILSIAAREVIWLTYARADWSQASEKFGMPMLIIRTASTDEKELDKIEQYAQNFGSNSYSILNKEDEVEITSFSGAGNFYNIYKEKINMCDSRISKLINGQTMTSDDGSSYSQANVHERILNNYTLARMQRIEREVNDKLIPFLINKGYNLKGLKFQYEDLIPKEEDPALQGTLSIKKKGLSMI